MPILPPSSKRHPSGRVPTAGYDAFRFGAGALSLTLTLSSPLQAADPTVRSSDVQVERKGDAFSVEVQMHAPVPPEQAWAVLTDFERMAEFIPNLAQSQVLSRSEQKLRVRQKGTARFGPFSTTFDSTRDISLLPPNEIRATGIGGNIRRMESVMRLEADGNGTRLHYKAEVVPDFWLPPLLGPSFVRHETAEQFSAMINEMLRRH